jgi:two-component system, NtrC family, response regulator AtoC
MDHNFCGLQPPDLPPISWRLGTLKRLEERKRPVVRETDVPMRFVEPLPPLPVLFGSSPEMAEIRQRIAKIAPVNVPVLIHGESGTGKNLFARLIHEVSPWRGASFVNVNCAAIPGTLLESELFGYEKGAFTGAYETKPGRIESAESGTLFLDEISELDASLQSKLLHLLQDGQFSRIGAQEDKKLTSRIICATNRNMENEMEAGRFRRDLFYRINVVNIRVPPLRERAADIKMLMSYFLETYSEKYKCSVKPLSARTEELLQLHSWPGNIRELENFVRRYVIVGTEDVLRRELTESSGPSSGIVIPTDGPVHLKEVTRKAVQELERKIILRMLDSNQWNRKHVARALNISYRALLYKIREVGVPARRSSSRRPDPPPEHD